MRNSPTYLSIALAIFLVAGCATSKDTKNTASTSAAAAAKAAAAKKDDKKGPKAFSDVIKDTFVKDDGVFNVYKDDQTYYYEIPNDQLGKEYLLVTRIAKTAEDIGYGGQKANTQVIRWDRNGDNIFLKVVGYENRGDENDPIYQAVRNSNLEPIVSAFEIKAYNADTSGVVIDVTSLYDSDVPAIGLPSFYRTAFHVRRVDGSRSYISSVKSFPTNIEVRHVLTYEAAKAPSNSSTNAITVEMAQSMVQLPEVPMTPRLCDDRVGLFSVEFTEYNGTQQRSETTCYVTRYKLEPKDPAAYARGELVEPVEPIVYYVDQNTPMKWRKPLIQGIEDWNRTFEAAGFKNAIIGKMAPTAEEDPDFSPEDARYSVIRYFASDIQNASGPHVHDPRTGQILESDINWYHNVMSLLRNWYLVQTAAINPSAQKTVFDDEVMAELVRFVSAHEVGHTLGYQHNMGSSYAYTIEQLRDPVFTKEHGVSPSIMDYARFNYVAQPGDGVTEYSAKVGEYDDWAGKWTYSWFDGNRTPEQERLILNQWVKERADDPAMWFGRSIPSDHRAQTENISNDEMEASRLGILNLERILDKLIDWSKEEAVDYDQLKELYSNVGGQYNRYIGHVSANVGGIYEQNKTTDQDGVVYTPVAKERQERAIQWLSVYVWTTPEWLIRNDILQRIEIVGTENRIRGYQVGALSRVLNIQVLARLSEIETRYGGDNYTMMDLFSGVQKAVFSELAGASAIDSYRRNLQRGYVDQLESLLNASDFSAVGFLADIGYTTVNIGQSDITAVVRGELEDVKSQVDRAATRTRDSMTRLHLRDLSARIDSILDADED